MTDANMNVKNVVEVLFVSISESNINVKNVEVLAFANMTESNLVVKSAAVQSFVKWLFLKPENIIFSSHIVSDVLFF